MALSVRQIETAKPRERKYRLTDGHGLSLVVHPGGGRYWIQRYRRPSGQSAELNIGVYPVITLERAREASLEARRLLAEGIDPGAAKKARKASKTGDRSFETLAREAIDHIARDWSSQEHHARQVSHMQRHVYPWIGHIAAAELSAPDVVSVLDRIDRSGRRATAIKLKSLIGQILRYGAARGWCERDVTQELRGEYSKQAPQHRPAITDPHKLGRLLRAMDSYNGEYATRAALMLSPLTFPRPDAIRRLEWSEINWDQAQWEVPASKMKTRTSHIIPLATQAIAILEDLRPLTQHRSRFVFPSVRGADRPLSNNTIRTAMLPLGFTGDAIDGKQPDDRLVTGAGFRPTARTMLVERMGYPEHLVKMQIGHVVQDIHGRAYDRSTFLPERRQMMQAWADFCDEVKGGFES